MATNRIPFPQTPSPEPGTTSWEQSVAILGYNAIQASKIPITEFDNTTTIPKIKQNAIHQATGTVYLTDSDTVINGSITAGDNYIEMSPAGGGATLSAVWTTTAPTWNYQYNHYESLAGNMVLPILVKYDTAGVYWKFRLEDFNLKTAYDFNGISTYLDNEITFSTSKTYGEIFDLLEPYAPLFKRVACTCLFQVISGFDSTKYHFTSFERYAEDEIRFYGQFINYNTSTGAIGSTQSYNSYLPVGRGEVSPSIDAGTMRF
jgi:hypothetical protein